jgi:hypothetical protein
MSSSAGDGRARATGNGSPQRQQASRPLLLRPAMEIYRIEDHGSLSSPSAATHDNAQAEPGVPSLERGVPGLYQSKVGASPAGATRLARDPRTDYGCGPEPRTSN